MGSCCSYLCGGAASNNRRKRFKVVNVDDYVNELHSGEMELTETELVFRSNRRECVRWPFTSLRRYGHNSNIFCFESSHRRQSTHGMFAFKCPHATDIFNTLEEKMQNNENSILEEIIVERNPQTGTNLRRSTNIPLYPTSSRQRASGSSGHPSVRVQTMPQADASLHPSTSQRPSPSSRLPSVIEESTLDDDAHTYVNMSGRLRTPMARPSGPAAHQ